MANVRTTTKIMVMSDLHAPYQDDKALKVCEQFRKDFKPDIVIALGDWLDATSVSSFASDTTPDTDMLHEFEVCNELLDIFQPTYFLEGNHEHRLRRAGAVRQDHRRLFCPKHWLKIKERKIKWIPYSHFERDVLTLGKLNFIHGFACSQYASMKEALRFGSVVHGHTHRIQMLSPPHATYKWTAFNIGCLCKLEQDYVETRQPHGWAHGFGWGYIYKSGNFTFNIARLIGDTVHLNGKEYTL